MVSYEEFVAGKALIVPPTGITGDLPALSEKLKEHQSVLVNWALRRGRAAIFADTGLGKGWMLLEWARVISEHTGKPVLLLAPLSVAKQFAREAGKLGAVVNIAEDAATVQPGINVTNYHKLHKFDVSVFGGVALDESSILKSLDGSTRKLLIESFRNTPFRLCATATPSPNDHTELGGQAEFLGIMTHAEMLASFFIRDGGSTQDWELKGHARKVFWQWVASWGAIVKMPSDIGCSDEGYVLPPLRYQWHMLPATDEDARKSGRLFAEAAKTLADQRVARRGTLDSRVAKVDEIINAIDGQAIVWCDLNSESEALAKAINGAVEVTGSMNDDEKEAATESFISGTARVLVSKPSLCGFGLNLQFARDVAFCGVTHSFEAFFQAIRRSWRFGVEGEVNAHVVSSELEGEVVANLQRKAEQARELSNETRAFASEFVRQAVTGITRQTISHDPTKTIQWPSWMQTQAGQ